MTLSMYQHENSGFLPNIASFKTTNYKAEIICYNLKLLMGCNDLTWQKSDQIWTDTLQIPIQLWMLHVKNQL